jgi:hypothetical protein
MKDTIVTAVYHYSSESRMGGRNYTFEYYENPFRNLLSLNTNIVVFSHNDEINKIKSFFERNNFIDYRIVEYDLNDCIVSDKIYDVKEKKNIINKDGFIQGGIYYNDRNTHLCLSKIEFVNIAISNNYFSNSTDNYYWIDAGLFHTGIIPASFGGAERCLVPKDELFWPMNKNNLCKPDLIHTLRERNNNEKLLFIGHASNPIPKWWDKISTCAKQIHIVGGIFGGDKNEILKIHPMFNDLMKQILASDELTLEEDILSIIISQNKYGYLKFDTWCHDVLTDPCYYGVSPGQKSFYRVFLDDINTDVSTDTNTNTSTDKNIVYVYGDSHSTIFLEAESTKFKSTVAGYDGASISGLNETTSRLEYGKHVIDIVTREPNTYYHMLKLGQVDLEFIMYHKIYVKREVFTFKEYCDTLIDKYREFINKILHINKNVIIASINLPSYYDDVDIKNYIKRIIYNDIEWIDVHSTDNLDPILQDFSLEQFTKNFIYFNGLLCELAKQLNLPFFDMTNILISGDTGLLKHDYRDNGHHYKGYHDRKSDSSQITYKFFREFFENIQ